MTTKYPKQLKTLDPFAVAITLKDILIKERISIELLMVLWLKVVILQMVMVQVEPLFMVGPLRMKLLGCGLSILRRDSYPWQMLDLILMALNSS